MTDAAIFAVDDLFAVVRVLTSTRDDGDFAWRNPSVALDARRRGLVDRPWVWVDQVHAATVVTVSAANADQVRGCPADALVTAEADLAVAVHTADCAPVVFAADNGAIGVAHAGWRGLELGVVEATADALRALGATRIQARLGPCIGPCCYEFGSAGLDRLVARFDPSVRSTTTTGRPALDLRAAVRAGLAQAGASIPEAERGDGSVPCTACAADRWFSHRARGETERLATVVARPGATS